MKGLLCTENVHKAYFLGFISRRAYAKGGVALINENLLAIIKADKQARSRMEEAARADDRAEKLLGEARSRFEAKYGADAEKQIAESAAAEEEKLARAADEYAARLDRTEKQIAALYGEKKDEWVSAIVQRVTAL